LCPRFFQLLSGDYEALLSRELNEVRIDGQPQNSSRPANAAGAINGRDQITKHQCLLLLIGFHDSRCNVLKHNGSFFFVFLFAIDFIHISEKKSALARARRHQLNLAHYAAVGQVEEGKAR
jgi:hypothetical protein